MELEIKTLTPLWTGGVETGKMDRLHETGLIGSLRWWYEAIARGLGGSVCDPTSDNAEHRCQFDTKAYEKTKNVEDGLAGVCSVCRLFGCTGWKRRFQLQATTTQLEPFWLATRDKANKFNNWWLSKIYKTEQSHVAVGELILHFCWTRGYENQHKLMQALLSLVSQIGALGAKSQYGFGIFSYADARSISQSLAIIKQNLATPEPRKNLSDEYQNVSNFWRLQCLVSEDDVNKQFGSLNVIGDSSTFKKYKNILLPVSFDIRYKLPDSSDKGLRQAYRTGHGKMDTRQLFGTLEDGDKRASNVFVSHLYKENRSKTGYQLRVWSFTDPGLITEIESSLKSIFPNLNVSQKMLGTDLLAEKEVSV